MRVQGAGLALRTHHLHAQVHAYRIKEGAPEGGVEQGGEKARRPFGYTGDDQILGELAWVPLSDVWLF
jgi:hypothetical protein